MGGVGRRTGKARDEARDFLGIQSKAAAIGCDDTESAVTGAALHVLKGVVRQAKRVRGILFGRAWFRGRRLAPGTLQSAHRYRPRLGHTPELYDGPRHQLHGDWCGGVERIQNSLSCGAPRGGAQASITPSVRSPPHLGHCSPTAYEGCMGAGGSFPGCTPWSPAS